MSLSRSSGPDGQKTSGALELGAGLLAPVLLLYALLRLLPPYLERRKDCPKALLSKPGSTVEKGRLIVLLLSLAVATFTALLASSLPVLILADSASGNDDSQHQSLRTFSTVCSSAARYFLWPCWLLVLYRCAGALLVAVTASSSCGADGQDEKHPHDANERNHRQRQQNQGHTHHGQQQQIREKGDPLPIPSDPATLRALAHSRERLRSQDADQQQLFRQNTVGSLKDVADKRPRHHQQQQQREEQQQQQQQQPDHDHDHGDERNEHRTCQSYSSMRTLHAAYAQSGTAGAAEQHKSTQPAEPQHRQQARPLRTLVHPPSTRTTLPLPLAHIQTQSAAPTPLSTVAQSPLTQSVSHHQAQPFSTDEQKNEQMQNHGHHRRRTNSSATVIALGSGSGSASGSQQSHSRTHPYRHHSKHDRLTDSTRSVQKLGHSKSLSSFSLAAGSVGAHSVIKMHDHLSPPPLPPLPAPLPAQLRSDNCAPLSAPVASEVAKCASHEKSPGGTSACVLSRLGSKCYGPLHPSTVVYGVLAALLFAHQLVAQLKASGSDQVQASAAAPGAASTSTSTSASAWQPSTSVVTLLVLYLPWTMFLTRQCHFTWRAQSPRGDTSRESQDHERLGLFGLVALLCALLSTALAASSEILEVVAGRVQKEESPVVAAAASVLAQMVRQTVKPLFLCKPVSSCG